MDEASCDGFPGGEENEDLDPRIQVTSDKFCEN